MLSGEAITSVGIRVNEKRGLWIEGFDGWPYTATISIVDLSFLREISN